MGKVRSTKETFDCLLKEIEKDPYRTVLELSLALGLTRARIYQLFDVAKDFGYEFRFKLEVKEVEQDGKKQRTASRKTKKVD